jgi:hypothetical protein
MDIPIDNVREIHAFAEALIETLERQIARQGITEGNVVIDAAINCLCYAMKGAEPKLEDDELLRRVAKYYRAMDLGGAPGRHDKGERA